MNQVCAVVLTLNEARYLPGCLDSLRWADACLVFDSFSTDGTVEIARQYGAQVIQHPFENYAQQRNAALQAVTQPWVLFIDADERVTPRLAEEIQQVLANPPHVGWWIPRHNFIFRKLTLHAGWYPDYQLRLLCRAAACYDPARAVHELVQLQGSAGHLHQALVHLNYETVEEFIEKQHRYTRYDASILHAQGQRAHLHNYVLQPLRQFYWRYVTLQGWRAGTHGLRLSGLMAYFQFWLYRYLAELNKTAAPD